MAVKTDRPLNPLKKPQRRRIISWAGILFGGCLACFLIQCHKFVINERQSSLPRQLNFNSSNDRIGAIKRRNSVLYSIQELASTRHGRPDMSFAPENLDSDHCQCGTYKCLFPLKIDPRLGYLVAPSEENLYSLMSKGYNVSLETIERKHKMEHVFLAPPSQHPVDGTLLEWLNQQRKFSHEFQEDLPDFVTKKKKIVTQLVHIILPEEGQLVGCNDKLFPASQKAIPKFYSNIPSEHREKVLKTSKLSFRKLYALLEDRSCLIIDLQFLVHRDGRILHLDTDRCYTPLSHEGRKLRKKLFIPRAHELEDTIASALRANPT